MGTKTDPGKFDYYARALPDEPIFVLLARDPEFYELVTRWADRRERDIQCGVRPMQDMDMVHGARRCAHIGARWRRLNNEKWKTDD